MGSGPGSRIGRALRIAADWGHVDGAHHKQWVIDQMVRALTAAETEISHSYDRDAEYRQFLDEYDGDWDGGTPP